MGGNSGIRAELRNAQEEEDGAGFRGEKVLVLRLLPLPAVLLGRNRPRGGERKGEHARWGSAAAESGRPGTGEAAGPPTPPPRLGPSDVLFLPASPLPTPACARSQLWGPGSARRARWAGRGGEPGGVEAHRLGRAGARGVGRDASADRIRPRGREHGAAETAGAGKGRSRGGIPVSPAHESAGSGGYARPASLLARPAGSALDGTAPRRGSQWVGGRSVVEPTPTACGSGARSREPVRGCPRFPRQQPAGGARQPGRQAGAHPGPAARGW